MLEWMSIWQNFWEQTLTHPDKLLAWQTQYWQAWEKLCQSSPEPINTPDKRFRHSAWQQQSYHWLKEVYLLNARYLKDFVREIPLDKKTQRKVNFAMDQWLNAVSPSNFLWTNPEVIQKTLESGGENLQQGWKNFLADWSRSQDNFSIRMTDETAFKIGEQLAVTPGVVVYENHLFQLIRYTPTTHKTYEIPLLMIPPWINKYYILDLQPHNSLVKWLVTQGFEVFMISWVNPDARHAALDFSDYVTEGALTASREVQRLTQQEQINTLGFCIGGTLLACTLAHLAATQKSPIRSATFLATLLDFTDVGDMEVFIDEDQISAVERLMTKTGYLDGGYMSTTFNLLRSNDLIWSYFVNNYLQGKSPPPFDILYWNADATNMPARMHSQYLREMYLENRLRQVNGMTLAGTPIDLSKVNLPTYCFAAQQDHIAPWQSVFAGMQLFSSPLRLVLGESGHIAGTINPPVVKKYGFYSSEQAPTTSADEWLANATFHPQLSWWEDWGQWLMGHSGKKIKSRVIPTAIEAAPGRYVKVRLRQAVNDEGKS